MHFLSQPLHWHTLNLLNDCYLKETHRRVPAACLQGLYLNKLYGHPLLLGKVELRTAL